MDEPVRDGGREKSLDRLICDAGKLPAEGFVRPSDDTIDAYVLGTADEGQRREVHAALKTSADFRKELLEMAEDLKRLQDPNVRKAADNLTIEPLPSGAREMLGKAGSYRASRVVIASSQEARRTLLKHRWLLPVAVTVCTVAVLATLVIKYSVPSSPAFRPPVASDTTRVAQPLAVALAHLSMVDGNVAPELLISNHLRSLPSAGKVDMSAWPDSTALQAIRALLEMDPSTFILRVLPTPASQLQVPRGEEALFQLVDSAHVSVSQCSYHVPRGADSVTAWVLGLSSGPGYALFAGPLLSDSVRVLWQRSMGTSGVVTITYRFDGRYHTAATVSFNR